MHVQKYAHMFNLSLSSRYSSPSLAISLAIFTYGDAPTRPLI